MNNENWKERCTCLDPSHPDNVLCPIHGQDVRIARMRRGLRRQIRFERFLRAAMLVVIWLLLMGLVLAGWYFIFSGR